MEEKQGKDALDLGPILKSIATIEQQIGSLEDA